MTRHVKELRFCIKGDEDNSYIAPVITYDTSSHGYIIKFSEKLIGELSKLNVEVKFDNDEKVENIEIVVI